MLCQFFSAESSLNVRQYFCAYCAFSLFIATKPKVIPRNTMKSVYWTLKLRLLTLCSQRTLFYSAIITIYGYLAISYVPPVLAINATIKSPNLAVHSRTMPEAALAVTDLGDDDDYNEDDDTLSEIEKLKRNGSAKGMYIGADCEFTCNQRLRHVFCDPSTNQCGCEKNYPVIIGYTKGCAKPKKLGDQCFWHETCVYSDPNSLCVQVSHNALCQCVDGFHSVSYLKPTKRVFCTEDMAAITSDLPTLLGVTTGIAVLAGLICMVLHLFSKAKYPRHRNYADASLPPPILYSSDTVHITGIPLTIQSARPSSRSSIRSSGSVGSFTNRRASSVPQVGSKGVLVSTSRTGAARSAAILLISCHISALKANSASENDYNSNMTKYLEKQLNQQRQLLHLELPATTSNRRIKTLLGFPADSDEDEEHVYSLDYGGSLAIGALPTPASDTAKVAVKFSPIITLPLQPIISFLYDPFDDINWQPLKTSQ
ncbi:uncharacterized protein LOC129792633 isoform X1 [Lutzomyia longipalpis]|uniref:uncharacterized protein LOC129792633 isoform X1 n=1 Tax=Lutzomyia longipalpis TaxID=7200 RepID=UPI002483B726|nr:uncharacterized protein LOC129792633 isoform X1 [Lutzomyia longipalpis]